MDDWTIDTVLAVRLARVASSIFSAARGNRGVTILPRLWLCVGWGQQRACGVAGRPSRRRQLRAPRGGRQAGTAGAIFLDFFSALFRQDRDLCKKMFSRLTQYTSPRSNRNGLPFLAASVAYVSPWRSKKEYLASKNEKEKRILE
jgi:hypothetical protein